MGNFVEETGRVVGIVLVEVNYRGNSRGGGYGGDRQGHSRYGQRDTRHTRGSWRDTDLVVTEDGGADYRWVRCNAVVTATMGD